MGLFYRYLNLYVFLVFSSFFCSSTNFELYLKEQKGFEIPIVVSEKNIDDEVKSSNIELITLKRMEKRDYIESKVRPICYKFDIKACDYLVEEVFLKNNNHFMTNNLIEYSEDIKGFELNYFKEELNKSSNPFKNFVSIVSGFWGVQNKYDHGGINSSYYQWINNSMRINMPLIFFTSSSNFDFIKNIRKNESSDSFLSTILIEREISSFITAKSYNNNWINSVHLPSKNLGQIWLEKINLIKIASKIDNTSEFFVWMDAALSSFRNYPTPSYPWSIDAFNMLPKNKISYCYAKDEYHSFPAGFLIIPRSKVEIIHYLFYSEFQSISEIINDWRCGSEQYILTRIKKKFPDLFHIISYDYGQIEMLWGKGI